MWAIVRGIRFGLLRGIFRRGWCGLLWVVVMWVFVMVIISVLPIAMSMR